MIDITNVIQCFCPGKRARGGPTAIHSTPSRPQHGDGLPKTLTFFFFLFSFGSPRGERNIELDSADEIIYDRVYDRTDESSGAAHR